MITRTVVSPAGETITLYTDAEFREVLDDGEHSTSNRLSILMQWSELRRYLLEALWVGGAIEDPKGRAAPTLLARAMSLGLDPGTNRFAATNCANSPAMSLCIERVGRGQARRTYSIRLIALPESWYAQLAKLEEPKEIDAGPPPADEPARSDVEIPPLDVGPAVPPPGDEPRPVLEFEIANSVAAAMLTQVVEIIAAGTSGEARMMPALRGEITALEERLGQQIAYADKLRRSLRETGDELSALKVERDGLRQRVRAAEHNLKVATGVDAQRIIDAEVRRQIDRVMRQTPVGEHSKIAAGS